ncbi:F0F1 ATP synthase subunit B [Patescibacteria group bacterium]|nr:F0F1 ATP synthase subunit B [Patescibacteria group bacterium]
MESLVKTFHIDAGLLLAQLVNFIIVLLVLYKFAYKPILKVLNDRTSKIEKGIKDAESSQVKLAEMEKKEKEVLLQAREEAQKIINQAEKTALKNVEDLEIAAKVQSEKTLEDAKKQIEQEKNKAVKEAKSEIAGLVISATEKIIGKKMDGKKDGELIEKVIK